MKRIISALLAAVIAASVSISFVGCQKKEENVKKVGEDVDLHDVVEAICDDGTFDKSLVSEFVYRDGDNEDESLLFIYGVVDLNANNYLKDYVVTLPTDYNQSIAIIVFDDGMTAEDYEEVKEVITTEYIHARASSLQMYAPEEYAIVSWQLENPELIWRQYDNALVLIMDGEREATEDFSAFEAAALK